MAIPHSRSTTHNPRSTITGRFTVYGLRFTIAALTAALALSACDSGPDDREPLTDITVLFAYTSAVADSMGDTEAYISRAVEETNAVYHAGNIPMRLVPVRQTQVEYEPADRLVVLERLLDPEDGVMDAVHPVRDEAEADVVVLVTPDRASTINGSTMATPETAFVLVWWGALGDPFYGMAHELAHLHGARHDVLRDPLGEPFPYGHGFRNDSLRTIMAGGAGTLVPRFSGPDQQWNGVILGDSSSSDVARVLRETAVYISNFRGPQTPTDFVPPGTWPTLP